MSMLRATLLAAATATAAAADKYENCKRWAEGGECNANPAFMQENCATACASAKDYSAQIKKECAGYADMVCLPEPKNNL